MDQGGQAGEVAGREKMGSSCAACTGDVQGRDGASGYGVGEYGPHLEKEGGVTGHRVGRVTVESFCSDGYLSPKKEWFDPRRAPRFQNRNRDKDVNT